MTTQAGVGDAELRREIETLRKEVLAQRDELEKLGKVVTEVLGKEFDAIMDKQREDQQSLLYWVTLSMALSTSVAAELEASGAVDVAVVRERALAIRRRLIEHAESIGSDADLELLFGDRDDG